MFKQTQLRLGIQRTMLPGQRWLPQFGVYHRNSFEFVKISDGTFLLILYVIWVRVHTCEVTATFTERSEADHMWIFDTFLISKI